MHQSDNVALTFYLFSSSDAVERDRMHFTPKTYIFIAAYCYSAELLTLSTSFHPCRNYNFFCKPYANIRNWCPQCLGMLLSFFNYRTSALFLLCYSLVFLKVYLLFLSVHIHDVVTNKAKPFK